VTSGAKKRTEGATRGDLILAAIVGSVIEAGVSVGLERVRFLERLGLRPEDFDDPDRLLPFESFVAAWEYVAAAPGSEDVGLRVGQLSQPRLLGALGYAMVHASSGIAAIRLFERFRRLASDTLAPKIDIDDDHVVFHLVWPARVARIVPFADAAFMGQLTLLRELCGLPGSAPLAVEAFYQCPRPSGADRSRVLGCPTHFGCPETRFVLRREPLERPLPRTDPALFHYLERHAAAVAAGLPTNTELSARVRRLVTDSLRGGEPTQARTAKALGMSERTLQRRLRDEGTTFARIVDGTRRELSEHYLSEPNVAAFEVAFLLGYSEPSAFHRAFRRWTGMTPQEYRQRASNERPEAAHGKPGPEGIRSGS
jgi:AraC-like DNA-binding protein